MHLKARWPMITALLFNGCAPSDERESNASMTVASVAGCYLFAADSARVFQGTRFWGGPVLLDTVLRTALDSADRQTSNENPAHTYAAVPESAWMDTAMYRARWSLVDGDSIVVTRSDGFTGERLLIGRNAGTFAGEWYAFSDVIDPNRLPVRYRVRATRVGCPSR
jgi:hypothetical protein